MTGKRLIRFLAHHHVSNSRENPPIPGAGMSSTIPSFTQTSHQMCHSSSASPKHTSRRLIAWLGIWQSHPSAKFSSSSAIQFGEPRWFAFNLGKNEALARVWDRNRGVAGTSLGTRGSCQALGTGSSGDSSSSKGTRGRTSSRTSGPTGFARRLRLLSAAMDANLSVGTSGKRARR